MRSLYEFKLNQCDILCGLNKHGYSPSCKGSSSILYLSIYVSGDHVRKKNGRFTEGFWMWSFVHMISTCNKTQMH